MRIINWLRSHYRVVEIVLASALVLSCCRNCSKKTSYEFSQYESNLEAKKMANEIRSLNIDNRDLRDSINVLNERLSSQSDKIDRLSADKTYYQQINKKLIDNND